MKKIIIGIIFLIFPFVMQSQKQRGIITFLDGTTIEGLAKISEVEYIKFKENKESKAKTFDYKSVKTVTIFNEENKPFVYEYIKVDYRKKPLLLMKEIDGFLSLYSNETSMVTTYGGGIGFSSKSTYHIKRKTDELGQWYICYGYVSKITFKNVIEKYFTDCKIIQEKVEKGEFKKDDYEKIVLFYNENCAPK